jgi:hypothetical protein
MAKPSGQITGVKLDNIERIGRGLAKRARQYDIIVERRMQQATAMVFNIAHQKRPYISRAQQKKGFRTKSGAVHHNRVSDPNARLGVPVAWVNGGTLQSAIRKEVSRVGAYKFQGIVYVDLGIAPYGIRMEYGDAKVHARPFMRPAAALTKEAIKKLFGARADIK